MPQILTALFVQLASIIGGTLNGVLGTTVSLMKSGASAAMNFHQAGRELGRSLGLGLNQANSYTKVLTDNAVVLAKKYGVTNEAIIEIQKNLSDATGKQLLLNQAQTEGFVQANRLIGAEATNRFTETVINGLGGQVHAVQGAISKAYATAAKQGLNAQKFSKTVADNLSMANRLNFRNGVDGITRMAAMAEKIGLDMKSVETAASNFMELDKAIENAASLQMLGGSIGAAFGNPLETAYEAQYDPEAFAERMENAMKGMATFDAKKGYATVSPMNQDILRNYAKVMGLNPEDVVKNAKKQAEVTYKERAFTSEIERIAGGDADKRNFIINNSQVTPEGRLQVNGQDVSTITQKQWDDMMAFDGKSDTDILKDQAANLRSINETITGNKNSAIAAFAKGLGLENSADSMIKGIDNVGDVAVKAAENLGEATGKALKRIVDFIERNGSKLETIAQGIIKVSAFISDHFKVLLAAIIAAKIGKGILGFNMGSNTVGGKLATRAFGGLKTVGGKAVASVVKVVKSIPKVLKSVTRKGVVRGIGLGLIGAGGNLAMDAAVNSGKVKKGGVGHYTGKMASTAVEYAGFGSMFGLLGAGIGAAVGAVKGAYDTWKSLPENADKNFIDYAKSVGNSILDGGKAAFSFVKDKIGPALSSFSKSIQERGGILSVAFNTLIAPLNLFIGAIKGIVNLFAGNNFSKFIDSVSNWFKSDNKFGKIVNKTADIIYGEKKSLTVIDRTSSNNNVIEKHEFGGVIGATPKVNAIEKHDDGGVIGKSFNGVVGGNSYVGDKIIFPIDEFKSGIAGLNSGEAVINDKQFAQLFNYVSATSSILSKIAKSNGVTYYDTNQTTNTNSVNANSSYRGNVLSSAVSNYDNSIINNISRALYRNSNVSNGYNANEVRNIDGRSFGWTSIANNVGGTSSISNIASSKYDTSNISIRDKAYAIRALRNYASIVGDSVNYYNEGDFIRNNARTASNVVGNSVNYYNEGDLVRNNASTASNIRVNGGSNTLSSILSTIFNSSSNVVSTALNTENGIKTIPFGENSFKKIPKSDYTEYSYNNKGEISVNDINVNVGGTIKLDGGSFIKSININDLLNDYSFISSLKEIIKDSINNDMNGGRFMNDNSTLRGSVSSQTYWGR